MALEGVFQQSVGLLLGDVEKHGGIDQEPVGTFFLLGIPIAPGSTAANVFMVTARHITERYSNIKALMRDTSNKPFTWNVAGWVTPSDDRVDIAVAPWAYPQEATLPFRVIPSQDSYEETAHPGTNPQAGVAVYFAGLLAPLKNLAMRGVPVVRTAAVSVWDVPDVVWHDQREKAEVKPRRSWQADRAHLIDTRSYGGFSGGPALLQYVMPGPRIGPVSKTWVQRVESAGNDPDAIGDIHTMTMWCGMFVGFIEETGIGVVVRSADIMEFIETSKEIQRMRDENRKTNEQAEIEQGAKGQSASETGAEYQRQDFLDDLQVVTRRTDSEQSDPEA